MRFQPVNEGVFILSVDITERRKLLEQQALFASIVNSSNDAIISKNLDGIITSWNHGAEKIFGYTEAEIIGKHISIIIPTYLVEEEIEIIDKIKKGENINHYETQRIRKDGKQIYVSITVSPLKDSAGNIIGASKISSDITELKKAERAILELNAGLEQKVIERTAQLEIVNKELEAFTYSVSHDLRAPLRAVNGFARILDEDYGNLFDEECRRLLGEVQSNATKMGVLIDDLLTFSRLGREPVNRLDVDMNELLKATIMELEHGMNASVEIKCRKLIPVKADHSLLLQVMINLVSNAIKYSSKAAKPLVEIRSKRGNREVIYSVTDNGVGFEMKYVHKLFGVFQRLHSETEFPGTGVGLAIVQRIIHKHGGKVWAHGEQGKGATFFFSLPDADKICMNEN